MEIDKNVAKRGSYTDDFLIRRVFLSYVLI